MSRSELVRLNYMADCVRAYKAFTVYITYRVEEAQLIPLVVLVPDMPVPDSQKSITLVPPILLA